QPRPLRAAEGDRPRPRGTPPRRGRLVQQRPDVRRDRPPAHGLRVTRQGRGPAPAPGEGDDRLRKPEIFPAVRLARVRAAIRRARHQPVRAAPRQRLRLRPRERAQVPERRGAPPPGRRAPETRPREGAATAAPGRCPEPPAATATPVVNAVAGCRRHRSHARQWAAVAVLALTAALAACKGASRYKVLSTFFDGVPAPHAAGAPVTGAGEPVS